MLTATVPKLFSGENWISYPVKGSKADQEKIEGEYSEQALKWVSFNGDTRLIAGEIITGSSADQSEMSVESIAHRARALIV
jgi:hypothetical protein